VLFGTDSSSLRAGWTYRSETKDKVPSIPKILALEQQRKFSPAGLCASHLSLSLALSLEPVDVAELQPDSASRSARTDPQRDSTPMCMAFGVPYSEHSSFFECALSLSLIPSSALSQRLTSPPLSHRLTCFALSLDYTRIIPTVNVHTAASRTKMKSWIDRWAAEKKRRADARMPRIVPFRALTYW